MTCAVAALGGLETFTVANRPIPQMGQAAVLCGRRTYTCGVESRMHVHATAKDSLTLLRYWRVLQEE